MDLKIFDSERLITKVQKRSALYNKATPEYSDRQCKEKLWMEVCEAVVTNWSLVDTAARVATGKMCKETFLCSLQFISGNSRIFICSQADTGHLSEPYYSDSRDIYRANYFISTVPSFHALKGLLPYADMYSCVIS